MLAAAGWPQDALADMVPVLPSGRNEAIKVVSGAIVLNHNQQEAVVVPASALAKWAALQGIATYEALQVSDVLEPADDVLHPPMVFLELETRDHGGDIDVDYARFIVPLAMRQLYDLLENGKSDAASLALVQPQPSGC